VALPRGGGALLLTGCEDKQARLWHGPSGMMLCRPLYHEGLVRHVAFSADGRLALTASAGGDDFAGAAARLWELPSGLDLGRPLEHSGGTVLDMAFSPDGKSLLTGHHDGKARLWDVASGRRVGPEMAHIDKVYTATFSPDGRTLLTAGPNGAARLWQRDTGGLLRTCRAGSPLHVAAFSPDGATFATGGQNGVVQLWRVATGERVGPPLKQAGHATMMQFGADGRCLWTHATDNVVRRWDLDTAQVRSWVRPEEVTALAFSPDRGRMLTMGSDGSHVQLRDRDTGRAEGPFLSHPGARLRDQGFTPDGKWALIASNGGTARLWDLTTSRPIGAPFPGDAIALAIDPHGRWLALGGDRTALFRVPAPLPGTPAEVRRWAERLTGFRLDDQGSIHAGGE
jgi:WD40 repeat protein